MRAVICDERISPKMEKCLQKYGYYIIKLPRCESLPEAISSHPDSLIFRLGNIFLSTCDYGERAACVFSDIREFSAESRIFFIDEILGKSYPSDTRLNAISFGKNLITNTKTISNQILDIAKKDGFFIQNVNQSYPNCSILKLNDDNAITADPGIYKKLTSLGINTLLIKCGGISLPPYEYGFIGGASGVDGDRVFFLGNLDLHPSASEIKEFITGLGMRVISLSDEPLSDLGGLIFI